MRILCASMEDDVKLTSSIRTHAGAWEREKNSVAYVANFSWRLFRREQRTGTTTRVSWVATARPKITATAMGPHHWLDSLPISRDVRGMGSPLGPETVIRLRPSSDWRSLYTKCFPDPGLQCGFAQACSVPSLVLDKNLLISPKLDTRTSFLARVADT